MTKEQHDFINQLAERYGAHMAQLSIRRIGDRDIALDLVQETFLIACCKADTVCTHVKPAAWLYQTLSNLTKQESEKFKREIHWDDFERISGSEDLDPSMELYIPDSLSDSDRELFIAALPGRAVPPGNRTAARDFRARLQKTAVQSRPAVPRGAEKRDGLIFCLFWCHKTPF